MVVLIVVALCRASRLVLDDSIDTPSIARDRWRRPAVKIDHLSPSASEGVVQFARMNMPYGGCLGARAAMLRSTSDCTRSGVNPLSGSSAAVDVLPIAAE